MRRGQGLLQRILGVSVGAIVTFLLLIIFDGGKRFFGGDANQAYFWAAVIGAIASFFWPIIIGWFLLRRSRARRDNQIQSEVERQMAEQQK